MTLVGKIFTVLILIMSVAFMMLAVSVFATHRNWRDMVMRPQEDATEDSPLGLRFQVENLNDSIERLRAEKERETDRLAVEQVSRRFSLASLQSQLEQADQRLQVALARLSDLQAAHGLAVEALNTNQINLEETLKEVEQLRQDIRDTRQMRDAEFVRATELQDRLNAAAGERQKLDERNIQLSQQVKRMQNVLDRNDLDEFTTVTEIPPLVDGVVMAVGRTDRIEISIGSDDGLRRGHTLEVFRRNSYLGRIVVEETEPDRSVGRILREYRKGIIKKGDRVATKFS